MTRTLAVWREILLLGFRAAPRWMIASLMVAVLGALSLTLYAVGFRQVIDGYLADDHGQVVVGASLAATLFSLGWAAGVLGANVNFGLSDRVGLHIGEEVARAAIDVPGIAHIERDDYVRELTAVRDGRAQLAAGPRHLLSLLQILLRALGVAILLGTVYPPLAALPLVGAVPFAAERTAGRIRRRVERAISDDQGLANRLMDLVAAPDSAPELRVYGLGDELIKRHADITADIVRRLRRSSLVCLALSCGGWVVFTALFTAGIGVVINRVAHEQSSLGQLLMVTALVRRSQLIFSQVADEVSQIIKITDVTRSFLWVCRFPGTVADRDASATAPSRLCRGIEFENVSFAYPGRQSALRDVTLCFPAGSLIALVGGNGAGKSTIVKLLTRMYEPTTGSIRVDGEELCGISADAWRSTFAATFQDFMRYELTAGENVGVGNLPLMGDATAIIRALESSGAPDPLKGLEAGLATPLGKSLPAGQQLSGGQWQKLALGRGMMRSSPLMLIFDEPAASLDPMTEHLLFSRLARIARERGAQNGSVTLFISHRFSTVRSADLVVVMDAGRVAEVGSHEELIAADGHYARLYKLQERAYT